MSNAQRAMIMAAGVFLSVALITIAVIIFSSAQEATKRAQNGFTTLQSELEYNQYSIYDGTTVPGSQVINAIRKFQYTEPFAIYVETKGNKSGFWYLYSATISGNTVTIGNKKTNTVGKELQDNALNEGSTNYVNPTGRFKAQLYTDNNDVIRAIEFIQQ